MFAHPVHLHREAEKTCQALCFTEVALCEACRGQCLQPSHSQTAVCFKSSTGGGVAIRCATLQLGKQEQRGREDRRRCDFQPWQSGQHAGVLTAVQSPEEVRAWPATQVRQVHVPLLPVDA